MTKIQERDIACMMKDATFHFLVISQQQTPKSPAGNTDT